MNRRELLTLGAVALWGSKIRAAEPALLESIELELPGDRKLATRARLLLPAARTTAPLRLLVLFHGLGETGNPALGLRAWPELYGLSRAYERLTQPPVARISKPARYLPDSRLRQLNASLAADPFRGFGVVCPVTPNAYKIGAKGLDRYADWVANALLPEVERRATFQREPHARGIDGCSLGGYVALEVFSRQPHLFGSVGSVQGAFGRERAAAYAAAIARAHTELGPRSVHVQSSLEDPYRGAAEHLAKQLSSHGVPHEVCIPPGPHDQAWLREVGTLEMLLWYDRALRAR